VLFRRDLYRLGRYNVRLRAWTAQNEQEQDGGDADGGNQRPSSTRPGSEIVSFVHDGIMTESRSQLTTVKK
jgi:hypothetical protein